MAARKVNLVAESSHIAVINRAAGIAISPSHSAHNKNVEVFLSNKKNKNDRKEVEKEAFFPQILHEKNTNLPVWSRNNNKSNFYSVLSV